MTKTTGPASDGAAGALEDEAPADETITRKHLLTRSKRDSAPIYKGYVQNPDQRLEHRAGPLSEFVHNGDLRGLRAFLFLHAIISSGEGDNGWSTTLSLAVWARVFDTTKTADLRSASTAATKVLTRLVDRKLIRRARAGRARNVTVTLLRPDGTGAEYTRPGAGNDDRFLKLDNAYWNDGWYEQLDLPATAMLLVALHEKPSFELATERMPQWYGWSADTAERGLRTLRDLGFLTVHTRIKQAPLSPTGATKVNVYTLVGPFAHSTSSLNSTKKTTRRKKTTGKNKSITRPSKTAKGTGRTGKLPVPRTRKQASK